MVLVTGATGFVGGRLVERLVLEERARVRVTLRRYRGAANVARFPVELALVEDRPGPAWRAAVTGTTTVYHCAHDWTKPEANVAIARALVEACAEAGVPRIVYLSSLAAYFPLASEQLSEASPWLETPWAYATNKRAVTEALLSAGSEQDVDVVVLEPVGVYGPFSASWVVTPAQQLRAGRVIVPPDGEALCNLVYVDDLVDAMLAAAEASAAGGERIIVNGPEAITWRALYERYAQVLGQGSITTMTVAEMDALVGANRQPLGAARRFLRDPRWILSSPAIGPARTAVRRAIGGRAWQRAKASAPLPFIVPGPDERMFVWARYRADYEKARRTLGYAPRFDLERGLDITTRYMTWARL